MLLWVFTVCMSLYVCLCAPHKKIDAWRPCFLAQQQHYYIFESIVSFNLISLESLTMLRGDNFMDSHDVNHTKTCDY